MIKIPRNNVPGNVIPKIVNLILETNTPIIYNQGRS